MQSVSNWLRNMAYRPHLRGGGCVCGADELRRARTEGGERGGGEKGEEGAARAWRQRRERGREGRGWVGGWGGSGKVKNLVRGERRKGRREGRGPSAPRERGGARAAEGEAASDPDSAARAEGRFYCRDVKTRLDATISCFVVLYCLAECDR